MTATPRRTRALGLVAAPLLLLLAAPVVASADTTAAEDDCTELVTHAPSGSRGDAATVAITSQVLVADVDGWDAVAWEASDGVEVDTVLVGTDHGTESREGTPTGHAQQAQQLTFCGEVLEVEPAGAEGPAEAAFGAPWAEVGVPLVGAAVGGLLAGLVLLGSIGGRRAGHDRRSLA